ncbi:MAG: DUF5658 family protein [Acidimicrobiia bacterium]|nr:DUF5658 family protein [Acidimicrobiia bacterium]
MENDVLGELTIDGNRAVRDIRVSTAMVLFTVLVGLNLGDMIITHVGLQRGVLREANPLMQDVVASLWTAAAVKVVALGAVAWFMFMIRARIRVVHATLGVAIAWYVVVVTWNTGIVLGVGPWA